MKACDVPKSGRWGDYVYYLRGGRQCRRRYKVPRDPRAAAQLRLRRIFGAASRAWGETLSEAERLACIAAGERVRSRVRLGQSGPLTGQ